MLFRQKSLVDMTLQTNSEERRFALRLTLRLPIVVSGQTADGETWSEPTETENISTTGAFFQLNQRVAAGDKLYLHSHRPDGIQVEVMAEVIRCVLSPAGVSHVAVAVRDAAEDWIRLFVAWVADEQTTESSDEKSSLFGKNDFSIETAVQII